VDRCVIGAAGYTGPVKSGYGAVFPSEASGHGCGGGRPHKWSRRITTRWSGNRAGKAATSPHDRAEGRSDHWSRGGCGIGGRIERSYLEQAARRALGNLAVLCILVEANTLKIVSFSGIDGAGKTTQICALAAWLRDAGLQTTLLSFWDDVVVLPRFREFVSHRAFKGDQGIGTPERPLHRRDKNVKSWPVTAMRFCLYFADALHLRRQVRRVKKKSDVDVVIFDRYIYDELANLPLEPLLSRLFLHLVLWLIPKPDVAYFIDADPVAARARKPEYPLEFIRNNRQAYLTLSPLTRGVIVIEPLPVEAMKLKVRDALLQELFRPEQALSANLLLQ
jgi:thymidylate kinase